MKKLILFSSVILICHSGFSVVPDWTNNMACIFYSHCTSCHNPNGIAPSSLLTYSDAVANAPAILTQVQSGLMPPFHADTHYQQYAHQKTLTQDEINEITNWVNNGMPSGDTTQVMAPPAYSSGAVITNPDFTGIIPTYNIPVLTTDMYRCFVISNPFATTQYITGFEVIPGNRAAVHHVLIFSDNTMTPVNLDNADPDPGYISFGGTGSNSSILIGGYVPGSEPYFLPSGMGLKVAAGSRIIIQVHYPISASGLTDSTRINFRFSSGTVREAADVPALNHLTTITDGPLYIPADSIKTFHEQYTVPVDVSVLSVTPHAHLICRSLTSYGVTPSGDTIRFETIPDWDFHWQGAYYFQKPIHIPAGTVLYGEATYDNTINNPDNPNNPPQAVSLGESTTDEMMLFYFVYVLYQSGDENIVIDTSGHLAHYMNCVAAAPTALNEGSHHAQPVFYPNPANTSVTLDFPGKRNITLRITNGEGEVFYFHSGINGKTEIDTRFLASGLYYLDVEDDSGNIFYKKLAVIR